MPFYSTDQRRALEAFVGDRYNARLEEIGALLEREVAPKAKEVDQGAIFPREAIALLAREGVIGLSFPKEYGGEELPFLVYTAAVELVSKACASTSVSIAIHNTVCNGIHTFGSTDLKERFLPSLVKGERLGCFALTESGSGSDAGAMRTEAVLEGDEYVLNGSKLFITNASKADVAFVFARTGKKHSAFLVEKGATGMSHVKPFEKLGFRGSELGGIVFKDCRVPRENLVGGEGKGFTYAKLMLNSGRITIAAMAVGIASAAYEKSLRFAAERVQFKRPIAEFQLIQGKLADMQTRITASRLMAYHAANLKDRGEFFAPEASQAKLLASEAALYVCDEAIQIHGARGYADQWDVHRHWRDAKLMTIGEGTSEIMRRLIAKFALKRVRK
ncbi:MAG: acyl-CoA dehydrogenase family protein [Euryarchaeota archaeon]|nr:acyl-CoA dehydrogenase family protein [Euryarchaeota archaeon]